ncbi:MAG: hypothetical protein ABIF77_12765 [bacterium]
MALLLAAGLVGGCPGCGEEQDSNPPPPNATGFVEIAEIRCSVPIRSAAPTTVTEQSSDLTGWRGSLTLPNQVSYEVVAPAHIDLQPTTDRQLVILEAGVTRIPATFASGATAVLTKQFGVDTLAIFALGSDGVFAESLALTAGDGSGITYMLNLPQCSFGGGDDAITVEHAGFSIGVRVDGQGRGVCSYPETFAAKLPARIPLPDTTGFVELVVAPELIAGAGRLELYVPGFNPPIFSREIEVVCRQVGGDEMGVLRAEFTEIDEPTARAAMKVLRLVGPESLQAKNVIESLYYSCTNAK